MPNEEYEKGEREDEMPTEAGAKMAAEYYFGVIQAHFFNQTAQNRI